MTSAAAMMLTTSFPRFAGGGVAVAGGAGAGATSRAGAISVAVRRLTDSTA